MAKEKFDASQAESKWATFWEEQGVYHWDQSKKREETFIVDTPPPTVSGSLHIGHVFSYTHQDLIVRYNRMQGKNIFYPIGWDDNGLPTERRVENYFNVRCDPKLHYEANLEVKNEKRPQIISRPNFIELCQKVTAMDEQAFKDLWQKIGLSVDWSLEYATINDFARQTCQQSFLDLVKKGKAYQATIPIMWDIKFKTAIAQAEIEDREMPGTFFDLQFKLEDGTPFTVATTRPELLAACVAIMVHPEDERYKDFKGKNAVTPLFSAPVPIMEDEKVDPEKGTGIVMVCTFGDVTDVEWWREYGLPLRQVIGENGRFLPIQFGEGIFKSNDAETANNAVEQLKGLSLPDAKNKMEALLTEIGCVLNKKKIQHAVKFYEKGSQPLELLPTRQWFIKLLDHKEELIAQGEKITWYPEFMKKRYTNWVAGLNMDWCISRQRHFGVPFPVWFPLNSEGLPDYSKPIVADESTLPVDPLSEPAPGYDESQRNQPNGFIGEDYVFDTWATSSLSPQISSKWVADKARHEQIFPMDVRPQAHEIIRTWAFYTITMAWYHEQTIPWSHVLISGWILDPDRKKMSKSKGNTVTPMNLIETYSSDAVRYWAARARAGVDTAYDESVFKIGKKLVTKLFNASRFVYDRLAEENITDLSVKDITEELDKGFVARLKKVVDTATKAFENYDWADALLATESFFWAEFCDDYLELCKARAYGKSTEEGKRSAFATLEFTVSVLLRLFAPVVPFITEELWNKWYTKKEGVSPSIHKSPWPGADEFADIALPEAADSFDLGRKLLAEVRKEKGNASKNLRWPIDKLSLTAPEKDIQSLDKVLKDVCTAGTVMDTDLKAAEGDWKITITLAEEDNKVGSK